MLETLLSFMGAAFYGVVPFLLVLSLLVFVHEWGHYIVARRCGVQIDVFSIGFGPEVFGWYDKAGTRWKVSWVPLGGYVKMLSDENPASAPDTQKLAEMPEDLKKKTLHHQSVPKKIAISMAGPLANYLLAIVLLSVLYVTVGQRVVTEAPIVGQVLEGSPAMTAGLQPKDKILSVEGQPISRMKDMVLILQGKGGETLAFDIGRGQDVLKKNITLAKDPNTQKGTLGMVQGYETRLYAWYQAPFRASWDVVVISGKTLKMLGGILTGQESTKSLSGPIGIAKFTSKAAQKSFLDVLWLMAFLSISLGLFNLLPIPMLDGGHIFMYIMEGIRGKPLSEQKQSWFFKIGFACVLGLLILSTWNDLVQLQIFAWLTHSWSSLKAFF